MTPVVCGELRPEIGAEPPFAYLRYASIASS